MQQQASPLESVLQSASKLFPDIPVSPKVITCSFSYKSFTIFNPDGSETVIPMQPYQLITGEWVRIGYWEVEKTLIIGVHQEGETPAT